MNQDKESLLQQMFNKGVDEYNKKVCLLRNFEMFEEKQITKKERNRIDMLLLSDDPENISLGIKIVEAKIKKHGRRSMEKT